MVESGFLRRDVAMNPGEPLRAGQSFEVRGDSLVTLAGGGNLRLARASAIEVLAANAVKLERGELYVDIPPGLRGSERFMVVTPAGEFRHVGTQFAVAIVNGMTRLRVREGSVQWHATEGDSTVNAGTEVMIDQKPHGDAPADRHRGTRLGVGGVDGAGHRNRESPAAGVPRLVLARNRPQAGASR